MTLLEYEVHRFDQIRAAIRTGDVAQATNACEAARREYVAAHDGMRDVVAATLDFAVRMTSSEEGEAIGSAALDSIMSDADGEPPQYAHDDLKDRVRAIAAGWHWHVSGFTLSEDDERITFRLDTCGSGMRLLQEGAYDRESGWRRSVRPSPSTFMQVDFPLYSNHCAEMTRASLRSGASTFLVEGWTPLRECGVCFQHTYKRFGAVPDEFYRRVGLAPPQDRPPETSPRSRLFSPDELAALATHPLDRCLRCLETSDADGAEAALDESVSAWRDSMHTAYRRWIGALWNELARRLGENAREAALEQTTPLFIGHIRGADVEDWAAFWSIQFGLRDIRAAGDAVEFVLDPATLLDASAFPGLPDSLASFCAALGRGLAARGWADVGRFSASDGAIVHHCLGAAADAQA